MIIQPRPTEVTSIRKSDLDLPLGDYVVWWYGALIKNRQPNTLPGVVVWLRPILADGSLGAFVRRTVGITELGLLQIGTIWRNGFCNTQLKWAADEVTVDFSNGSWEVLTQADEARHSRELIPQHDYLLPFPGKDRSKVLALKASDGRRILIPCLEFYSRCYGRSGHVVRVLSTYEWEDAYSRLYLPIDFEVPRGSWAIKLAAKCFNDDAVFLAHVLHDEYARERAKLIQARLDRQFGESSRRGESNRIAFLTAEPWFQGPARLLVEGLRLGNTFLALRIVGGSEPGGAAVHSYRENPGKADRSAPEDAPTSRWANARTQVEVNSTPIINLTAEDAPDHDGDSVIIETPKFVVVGERRPVIHMRLSQAATRPGPPRTGEPSDQYSSDERSGAPRGTGVGAIHTESAPLTEGAVRDVWNALLYLRGAHPDLISQVGWYDPSRGNLDFTNAEPLMVKFRPLTLEEQGKLGAGIANWAYLEARSTRLRGVLVAAVRSYGRTVFLFEVQRRESTKADGSGQTEEKLSGLVAVPGEDTPLDDWIRGVLRAIRLEQGVMRAVKTRLPLGSADDYRRSHSKSDAMPGQSTVINALGKMGVVVPRPC